MKVIDIMTENPVCCSPDAPLPEVARLMAEHDCGAIPVVDEGNGQKLVGVITDRDIVCRTLARDLDPRTLKARDCMSPAVVTITPNSELEECCQMLERYMVRRILVADARGACVGIVSQADIARKAPEVKAGEVVKEISQPTPSASRAEAA